ncbi:hypothetical protein PVAP13_9NG220273 [Panicum virgatum]|uniref:Uncharacterized protein n=1 Tax=Panicum virgatum TaxID=38727 RepID=A0A8T0MKC0_PANVG|nr:hypothetical protein PVAP13_9NG220273 [Panicum virgatum]
MAGAGGDLYTAADRWTRGGTGGRAARHVRGEPIGRRRAPWISRGLGAQWPAARWRQRSPRPNPRLSGPNKQLRHHGRLRTSRCILLLLQPYSPLLVKML